MHIRNSLLLGLMLASLAGSSLAQQSPAAIAAASLTRREADYVAFRHELHRRPEPSGQEVRTSAALAQRLRALGLEVRTGVGGHGIVAIVRGARPGPLVAFRADMDAVRSDALDPADYRSEIPGVRHICGHDVHATIGLAIAEAFAGVRDRLGGSVMLVFQPAEETASGARAMLADGVFAGERPVAIYAVHTAPLELGTLGSMAGGLMAGRDQLWVGVSGTGDLAPVAEAARGIIRRMAKVGSDPTTWPDDVVFVNGVERRQVASGAWEVTAGLAIAEPATRERVRATLLRELAALERPGVRVAVHYDAKTVAGVTNDPALVSRADAAIVRALGAAALRPIRGVVPGFSEDFGSFQDEVPGVMYFLGVSNAAKGTRGMPHSADHVADDGAIVVGARAMVAVMLERMGVLP
jgi:metal-dependent amidase/aminoacylase/carboxypeptidase family protein